MKKFKEFLLINFGLFLVAAGINFFKAPNHFAIGGVSGISIILAKFMPNTNLGPIMMGINIVLLALGFVTINKDFGSKTVYSSFALSIMVWILGIICPVKTSMTGDTMLELMFAIILPAVGSAIVFNQNASTGGTDIVAKILSKHTHINIGKTLLMADFIITVVAGIVYGPKIGMYSVLGLILKGFIIDIVIESMNVCKQLVIISNNTEEIKKYIIDELHRGATINDAYGAFTNEKKEVITTLVDRRQAVKLRDFIHSVDPKAFITIHNTYEIIGKGFRNVGF